MSLVFAGRNLLRYQLKMGSSFSSVPRPRLVYGFPDRGKIMFERKREHMSHRGAYGLEITCPSYKITGIACCPVADEKIQSPEATVESGGVSYNHVRIYLEPIKKDYDWAYELVINAEEDASQKVRIE